MKNIGIIGGLGPEATIDYYKSIIDTFKVINNNSLNNPEIVIYSVNMAHFFQLLNQKTTRVLSIIS